MSGNNPRSSFDLFSIICPLDDDSESIFSVSDNQVQFPESEIVRKMTPVYLRPLRNMDDTVLELPEEFIHSVDRYLSALQKYSLNPCDSYAFSIVKDIHQHHKISRKPLFPFSINSHDLHFPFPLYSKDPDVARYLVVRSPQYFKGRFSLGVDGKPKDDETTN